MLGNEGMIQRGRGLVDLIAGVTPTLAGWTNDPTDAADITDGDISTFCDTGNRILNAWQEAIFEWDLGNFYNIVCAGVGGGSATVGTLYTLGYGWNGTAWGLAGNLSSISSARAYVPSSLMCSKVRLSLTSSANSTITPNIREFHVWRL